MVVGSASVVVVGASVVGAATSGPVLIPSVVVVGSEAGVGVGINSPRPEQPARRINPMPITFLIRGIPTREFGHRKVV
jgi:hypothetical protein